MVGTSVNELPHWDRQSCLQKRKFYSNSDSLPGMFFVLGIASGVLPVGLRKKREWMAKNGAGGGRARKKNN